MTKNILRNIGVGIAVIFVIFVIARKPSECPGKTEKVTIRGDSLGGILDNGDEIKVSPNYYACNPVSRGDIIILRIGMGNEKLIKVVRAIPGDVWGLVKQDDGTFAIEVNGQLLRTTTGVLYRVDAQRAKVLQLYISDYKGNIPSKAYLVLGNQQFGSRDSTTFGLVSSSDFAGKAMVPTVR